MSTTVRTSRSKKKAKKDPRAVDAGLVKALSHPLRFQILRELNNAVASPTQLATRLDADLGVVSYHVKILSEYDAIELVSTRPRRGAIEHFYRATTRPMLDDAQVAALPASARRSLIGRALGDMLDHATAAAAGSGFDDPTVHCSWSAFQVDDEGWEAIGTVLREALERLAEVEAESAVRLANDPDAEKRRAEASLLLFEPVE